MNTVMKAWMLLVASALLQIGWLISLRATAGFRRPVPLLFYAAFGFLSTFCLSRAMESISMAAAYAAWTGLSVAGSLLLSWVTGTETLTAMRVACIVAILAGTTGLRATESSPPSPPADIAVSGE